MLCIGLVHILHAKVVDDQCEADRARVVLQQARRGGALAVVILCKSCL